MKTKIKTVNPTNEVILSEYDIIDKKQLPVLYKNLGWHLKNGRKISITEVKLFIR